MEAAEPAGTPEHPALRMQGNARIKKKAADCKKLQPTAHVCRPVPALTAIQALRQVSVPSAGIDCHHKVSVHGLGDDDVV